MDQELVPPSEPLRRRSRFAFLPLIVFCVLVALTGALWYYTDQAVTKSVKASFENDSTVLRDAINNRLTIYLTSMYGIRGLFAASEQVERNEFITYLNASGIQEKFPGISGTAFIEHVQNKDKQAFLESVRKDTSATASGYPNFVINPPGERSEYYVLTFTRSSSPSATFGFDYLTNVQRAQAIRKAVDTGNPVATELITLLGNPSNRKGFLVFLPVYKNGMAADSVSQRKQAIYGLVFSGFSADDLFNTILSEQKLTNINIEVFDSASENDLSDKNKLYDTKLLKGVPLFTSVKKVMVGERTFTIRLYANSSYGRGTPETILPFAVGVSGLIFSLLFALSLYLVLNSRARAISLAEKITQELKQSEERYRTIFETLQDVYYRTDISGKILAISPSVEKYLGISPVDLIGKNASDFYYAPEEREKMLQELKTKGSVSDYSLNLKTKDGKPLAVSLTGHLLYDEKKQPIGLEGILRDVTERKRIEGELYQRTSDLERINKTMTDRELKMIELKNEIKNLKQT